MFFTSILYDDYVYEVFIEISSILYKKFKQQHFADRSVDRQDRWTDRQTKHQDDSHIKPWNIFQGYNDVTIVYVRQPL